MEPGSLRVRGVGERQFARLNTNIGQIIWLVLAGCGLPLLGLAYARSGQELAEFSLHSGAVALYVLPLVAMALFNPVLAIRDAWTKNGANNVASLVLVGAIGLTMVAFIVLAALPALAALGVGTEWLATWEQELPAAFHLVDRDAAVIAGIYCGMMFAYFVSQLVLASVGSNRLASTGVPEQSLTTRTSDDWTLQTVKFVIWTFLVRGVLWALGVQVILKKVVWGFLVQTLIVGFYRRVLKVHFTDAKQRYVDTKNGTSAPMLLPPPEEPELEEPEPVSAGRHKAQG